MGSKKREQEGVSVNDALQALHSLKHGDLLTVPVPPLNLPATKVVQRKPGKLLKALLYGDTHFPDHCQASLDIVQAISEDHQPDLIFHVGDLLDATHLSLKYKPNPLRTLTLQDEINLGRQHLGIMRRSNPQSEMWYLEGNHEERLTRLLWSLEGPQRALMLLTDIQRAMTWPALLGLDQLGIKFQAYHDQGKHPLLPKFIVKHGNRVRQQSAYTANAEHSQYGMSGASGHTHRLGQFFHRDHNGHHIWIETGCTRTLAAEYTSSMNWQNGCVWLTIHADTGAFQAECVDIQRGNAVFRDKLYDVRGRRRS